MLVLRHNMSDPLNINVQSSTGSKYPLQIPGTATIAELKKLLAEKAEVVRVECRAPAHTLYAGCDTDPTHI